MPMNVQNKWVMTSRHLLKEKCYTVCFTTALVTLKNSLFKIISILIPFIFSDPYDDDDLKVKTQRPRSADQPGVFQAQTGE